MAEPWLVKAQEQTRALAPNSGVPAPSSKLKGPSSKLTQPPTRVFNTKAWPSYRNRSRLHLSKATARHHPLAEL
ncbi:unnamed protein product [Prunus armeniaca]|uniref:Uncharacterized protein n=1 Tax=Prunus armeniaca TaxID=36596 RepID=A0A6J5WPV7_PRUAR|nr:unnamed protein product [Prunus armeniaca]